MKYIVLPCECSAPEHRITFMVGEDEIYATLTPIKLSFWKRLRYLLTGQIHYGLYEEAVITPEAIPVLEKIIDALIDIDSQQNDGYNQY